MPHSRLAVSVVTLALIGTISPALSQQQHVPDQTLFVLGGPLHAGHFSQAVQFWEGPYESNYVLGAGTQKFLYSYGSFGLGLEAGTALRFGEALSAEVWAGGVARFTTFELGPLNITPALTAGLSVVTAPIGAERTRAEANDASPYLLYYLSPEIAVSHDAHPDLEVFGRIQHRSGGFGTIAHLDGSNAATLGLRYRF